MHIIDQILIVRVCVNGFNMPLYNAIVVLDHLEDGRDGIGGTGGGRLNGVVLVFAHMVDTEDDIWDTLARRSEQYFGNTLGG